MNILILLGHPNKGSFNHALADACKEQIASNGHTAVFHDLYEEQFSAVPTLSANSTNEIKIHSNDLINSDGIIIIHPNWWGQPPAIVKGWLDRVLLPGVAYTFVKDVDGGYDSKGMLKAWAALVLNTSDTSEELEETIYKDPLETIWKNRVFRFCGVTNFKRINFRVMKNSDENQRNTWLQEARELIDRYFPKA